MVVSLCGASHFLPWVRLFWLPLPGSQPLPPELSFSPRNCFLYALFRDRSPYLYRSVHPTLAIRVQTAIGTRAKTDLFRLIVTAFKTIFSNRRCPLLGVLRSVSHPVGMQRTPCEIANTYFAGYPTDTVQASFPDSFPPIEVHDLPAIFAHDDELH